MVPPNNLGPDLSGKFVNETQCRGMIGSLMYLTTSRLDIKFTTCLCTRYQANPKESYLIAVKRIFEYLKGTPSLGLCYPKCLGFDLKGNSESDYASCNMDRKSTSSACQFLGGKLVCWSAKKQQSIAMSSAKAEYVAIAGCCANILWMKSQLTDYDIIYENVPILYILKGDTELHFIPTQYQLADIFTKPLDEPTFKRLMIELESSSHNTSSSEITPKEEPVTIDKCNSDFISKCFLKEAFTRAPTQYKEYLNEFWYTTKTLEDSKVWVSTLTGGVNEDIDKASKSKTGQSKIETKSSLDKNKSPSHLSPPTLVVGEMHKEAHQAIDRPTSLGATSEEGAHPQLSSGQDASVDSTAEADPGSFALNDSISS
nr:uncharacterized mitochondrial protein AtMg00810-like [Tanacetum cinerariifolium]